MSQTKLDDGRKVTIRPITRDDIKSLHTMYLVANKESRQRWGRPPLYPWPMEINALESTYLPGIERADKRYHASVAVDKKGEVVGYIRAIHRADKDFTTFHTIVIRDDYRGCGLFDELTNPMIAESAAQGKNAINFSVNSQGAMPLYKRKWSAQEAFRKESKYAGTIVHMSFDPQDIILQRQNLKGRTR